MKRWISLTLVVLLLLTCFAGCNITQNISGNLAENAESTEKVEAMLAALAEERAADAKLLMHPQVAAQSDAAIAQMSGYLAGRSKTSMNLTSLRVNSSVGTASKIRQEQVSYRVKLSDGTEISVNAVYLSNQDGEGFSAFQLALGTI